MRLSPDALAGLLRPPPPKPKQPTSRERAAATGMRRMEATRLELGDVDAGRCVVLIREGKGRKDRLLPLGERALHWVQQYLERGRPELAWNLNEPRLFLGNEGNPLHPMWLSTLVARYIERAELGKHGGPHLIRHTMATLMLEGGAAGRCCPLSCGSGSSPSPRPSQGRGESLSAVSGARPSTAKHRPRRASVGALPRQGQALTGGRWPAWTRLLASKPPRQPPSAPRLFSSASKSAPPFTQNLLDVGNTSSGYSVAKSMKRPVHPSGT